MKRLIGMSLLIIGIVMSGGTAMTETSRKSLPEANQGIAAKYPGDTGIENDTSVVFVEKFDLDSVDAIAQRWDSVQNRDIMSLSSDVPEGSTDGQSLLMTHVGGKSTGGHLYRQLLPGYNQLFVRFYVKFHPDCAQIHHFGPRCRRIQSPDTVAAGRCRYTSSRR